MGGAGAPRERIQERPRAAPDPAIVPDPGAAPGDTRCASRNQGWVVAVRRGRLGFAGPLRGGSAGPGPGSWDAGCAAVTNQPSGVCGSPDQLPQSVFDSSHRCMRYDPETPSAPGS
jgi:hypothetical protein